MPKIHRIFQKCTNFPNSIFSQIDILKNTKIILLIFILSERFQAYFSKKAQMKFVGLWLRRIRVHPNSLLMYYP